MGASSIINCCCLLLILLEPSVHCYNVKKPKPEDKGIAETDEEKQQMKSFTGRKFIFGNEFGRRRKWDSFRTEEELGIVLWRRLLEDKEEPTAKKEVEKQHEETQESSQNTTLPEDPKKETTPMSELMNPSGVKLEVKDVNVEELKATEKNTTENLEVDDVQKQLNDGTENDNREWKSTGELADGIKENIQVGTTPGTSTEAKKQETQNTGKESALDLTEKGMQEMENNQAEMQTNSTEVKTEIGPREMESNQTGMQTNSTEVETEIGPREMEIGPQKIESNGDEMRTNSTEAETDIRMQKIENTGVEFEMQTNSVDNKTKIEMQKTKSNEGEMQIDSVDNKTEIGMQKIENHVAETLKTSTEFQGTRTEGVTNSTDTGAKESEPESETLTDFKGTKAQNAINIELQEQAEPLANSKVSMNPDLKSTVNSKDNETNSTGNLESATNSRGNKIEEAESFTNSTSVQTHKTKITEAETLPNSEEAELEKISESTKANPLQRSSQTETKEAESLSTETLNNSTDTEMESEIETEKARNSEEEGERKSEEEGEKKSEEEGETNSEEQEDLIQEFRELPSKLQDTAEKVADHLMPGIQKLSNKSKIYFNMANEEIAQGFQPLVGRHYAPAMATTVSCLFLLIPLFVTFIILDQIRAFLPLQKLLFLANIYLTNYFATLMFASFILGMEPMEFFYRNSPDGYIYLQLLQGLGYVVYLSLHCCNMVGVTTKGSFVDKLGAGIQLMGALSIGLHYYVKVFHRAMAHKPPRTCWRVHAVYVLVFAVLSFISRLKRGKKEYVHAAVHGNTHKKN